MIDVFDCSWIVRLRGSAREAASSVALSSGLWGDTALIGKGFFITYAGMLPNKGQHSPVIDGVLSGSYFQLCVCLATLLCVRRCWSSGSLGVWDARQGGSWQ